MKTQQRKAIQTLLILSSILAYNLDARADDNSSKAADKKELKEARFMLEDKTNNIGQIAGQVAYKEIDFSWSVLSKNSASNGVIAKIGQGSGKPYYQFEDGLPHPYYLVNKSKL